YSALVLLFSCCVRHPDLPSFPTRRSSDLVPEAVIGEMHIRSGRYIGVAPVPGGLTNVCLVKPSRPADPELADPTALLLRELAERSEEHTSELQSLRHLVCRLLLEKKKI